MRVVLDTNILVSSLLSESGSPGLLVRAWLDRRFILLTCTRQMDELRATVRKPYIVRSLRPARVGRLFNELNQRAVHIGPLPFVVRSVDPEDDFLLALRQAGVADTIVSGDKSGLLELRKHGSASIVTARTLLDLLG